MEQSKLIRVSGELHRRVAIAAAKSGERIGTFAERALESALSALRVRRDNPKPTKHGK